MDRLLLVATVFFRLSYFYISMENTVVLQMTIFLQSSYARPLGTVLLLAKTNMPLEEDACGGEEDAEKCCSGHSYDFKMENTVWSDPDSPDIVVVYKGESCLSSFNCIPLQPARQVRLERPRKERNYSGEVRFGLQIVRDLRINWIRTTEYRQTVALWETAIMLLPLPRDLFPIVSSYLLPQAGYGEKYCLCTRDLCEPPANKRIFQRGKRRLKHRQ